MAPSDHRKSGAFPARCRLRRGRDFDRLFDEASTVVAQTLVFRALPSSFSVSRCGVIASKRTFRRAVDRNRAKRLLREVFRLERDHLPSVCDVVLIARKRILLCKLETMRKDFRYAVSKVRKSLSGDLQA